MTPAPDAPTRTSAPIRVAALLGFLGVGMGAFGAHGLEGMFESKSLEVAEAAKRMAWWETAAFYHLIHAVALAAGGAAAVAFGSSARWVTWCFALGVLIFSGTLYAMALGAPSWFGAITPIGGLLLMVGWASLWRAARPGGEGGARP